MAVGGDDRGGEGGRMDALARDNEGLRQALDAARAERASLLRFLDTSALAITHMARDGTVLFINQAGARNMGGTPSQFIGKCMFDLIPAHADGARQRIEQTLDEGKPVEANSFVKLPTGECWFRSTYYPVLGESGVAESVQLISQDITELKRVERTLESTQGQLAGILEYAPHVVVVLDPDGVISYINRAPEGYSVDKVVGANAMAQVPPHHAASLRDALRAVMETGSPQLFELDDLFDHHWEVRLAPLRRDGQVRQVLAFVVDIGERRAAQQRERQLEAQVQHAQKLESLGVLAGGIAHDFNNLLVGVLGNAELARRRFGGSDADEYLDGIEQAARRAADLCRQMLAYAGRGQLTLEVVDLSKLAADTLDLLPSVSARAQLFTVLPEDLPPVRADATQLQRVVMNLLTNAADALGDGNGDHPPDGVIHLRCDVMDCDEQYLSTSYGDAQAAPGRYVYVEVQDTGRGMDQDARSRMFDPFFTSKKLGSGLGLAAVLGIVRRHRGTIHVDSEPGVGTRVRIGVPAITLTERPRREPAPVAGTMKPGTILVVDDEPAVSQVARRILEAHGQRVVLAEDGVQALEIYDMQAPAIDAVLLDLSMPRMGGIEALKQLRARAPHLPVVLASGFSTATDNVGEGDPETAFIGKPYDIKTLLRALQRVIDAGRARRD